MREIRDKKIYRMLLAVEQQEKDDVTNMIAEVFRGNFQIINAEMEHLYETVRKRRIDVLILSVCETDMRYIENIRRIKKEKPSIKVVVLSSLYFPDLVSEFVNIGIAAYITVPVRRTMLYQEMEQLFEQLEVERKEQKVREEWDKKMKDEWQILEKGFVYSMLYGVSEHKQLQSYCRTMGIPEYGCICNIVCKNYAYEVRDEILFNKKLYEELSGLLKAKYSCAIGPRVGNHIVIYFGMEKEKLQFLPASKFQGKIRQEIENAIKDRMKTNVNVYWGGFCKVENIYDSYQSALEEQYTKGVERGSELYRKDKYVNQREYTNQINKLMDSVKFGREDATEIFFGLLHQLGNFSEDARKNIILQLLNICCHVAYTDGNCELQFLDLYQWTKELDRIDDFEKWAYQKFEFILQQIQEYQGRNTSSSVKIAVDYIEKNFDKEISLEDVSRYVGVSPQHFSKIFKQETGANYVDWLTKLRIEQAKKYLHAGKHTIKEVCFQVGYKDPNYFSRIFRKIVGMTPSEYAKMKR